MGKITFASGLISDAGSIEAFSTVAANFPITNLLTIQPGEKARFTDPGAAFVEMDIVTAQAITFAGLINHNGSPTMDWRVRAADSQGDLTAAPPFDTGLVSGWPASGKPDADVLYSFRLFPAETRRWWRIDVADAGNPDGHFDLGRFMLANAWQPSVNIQFGNGIGWIDPSEAEQSVAGHLFTVDRPTHRVFTLPLAFQSKADMITAQNGLYELERKLGAHRDVFVAMDPDEDEDLHRQSLQGLMRGTTSPLTNTVLDLYETSVRVEELLP